ncbi:hypothetical protein ACFOEK_09130 [Litoribrevibacter euphylliae]|uniref:Tetratricopeptide repeat protein n=1 Tax=Litoribrevibacter euphylliae TaxID=1834034 RepID=A0ABV7HBK4_9GAMM
MLGNTFEQCISIAFMAEEDHDYAAALSYLIKAMKLAHSAEEASQCKSAINICLNELEVQTPHTEELLILRKYCMDNPQSANILS